MNYKSKEFKKRQREQINSLEKELNKLTKECEHMRSVIISTMHELREFSSVITDKSYTLKTNADLPQTQKDLVDNIYYTSGMLAARLNYTDIEVNPGIIKQQARNLAGIYKKFDKARYLLKAFASEKNTRIEFHGNSRLEMNVIPAFDMVPFVILQNAVKYSPPGYSVDIYFTEELNDYLEVEIRSYGPPVDEDEIPKLFDREMRGRHTDFIQGQGLGLHLAKRICDLHAISITVHQGNWLPLEIGGRSLRQFIIKLIVEKF